MALLTDPWTGDDEPGDRYADRVGDLVYCPECATFHPFDEDGIYSACDWAQDQMDRPRTSADARDMADQAVGIDKDGGAE